ncbi:hypothetical protein CCR75_007710 [Bremia lactucae]|uniref:subtilisin n=1 Tax=Bremia lactucae TaxID=4779 RepID=A0A976FMA5_BRELC|nr:hypothetical protein CCR75_007710 [Bremia lactucae]
MQVCFLSLVLAAIVQPSASSEIIDQRGLEFVSQDAFCAYHCSSVHVAVAYRHLSATSECVPRNCDTYLRTHQPERRLRPAFTFPDSSSTDSAETGDVHAAHDGKDVTIISVVSCVNVTDVTLAIGDPETDAFANFYTAFTTAYDAMLSGTNATFDACQLQFLQKELLSTYSAALIDENDVVEVKPTLIKLFPSSSELECIQKIKAIWPSTEELHTPFLTQSDSTTASSTVLLVHVSSTVGDTILALECVESVTILPAILKLMPFAKSSYAFARTKHTTMEGPALEIRLAHVAKTQPTLARLAAQVTHATGIQNLLTMKSATSETGGVLLQAAVDDYDTWTRIVAIILDDDAVEWVDRQQVVTSSSIVPYPSWTVRSSFVRTQDDRTVMDPSRRLDAYVQDLVGVHRMHENNITGSSIVVGVTDTGLYIDHDQFDQESRDMYDQEDLQARKVVYYQTFANNVDEAAEITCGHGTHVSGIVAGSSYSKKYPDLGIASSARIAFMDIGKQASHCIGTSGCDVSLETPGEVANLMKAQVAAGAKIFSFSWGTGANDYNTQTQQVDEYLYDHPEILIIVAAGNSGDKGEFTISSPSGAKNVISVGASLNAGPSFVSTPCESVLNELTVASFSSIGPTLDGRQKPDLVAPGMSITSAQSEKPGETTKSSAMCSLQGTSQATPVIAGMAVLIYEWLRDGWWKHGVADPRYGMEVIPASLLKALLLHSGEAMSRRLVEPSTGVTSCVALEATAKTLTSYPDVNQGYGKPTLLNLVSFAGDKGQTSELANRNTNTIYFFPNSSSGSEPSVKEGAETSFHFMLTEGVNLRVTIAWTDPPGSVGSKTTLQNDLDLTLKIANTSAIYYPLSGNGSRDSVNNVEMVEVSYDTVFEAITKAGITVTDGYIKVQAIVRGHSVKAGESATTIGQKFAIVASSTPMTTSASSRDTLDAAFWQPWMTIGAIVVGTLVLLFVIALIWRVRAKAPRDNLKAVPAEYTKRVMEERGSIVSQAHSNYRNVQNSSLLPAMDQSVGSSHRMMYPSSEVSLRLGASLEPLHPPRTASRTGLTDSQIVASYRRESRDRRRSQNMEKYGPSRREGSEDRDARDRRERPRSERRRERSVRVSIESSAQVPLR